MNSNQQHISFSDNLINCYDSIFKEKDVTELTTKFLCSTHALVYARRQSNYLNNRQGKNRTTYSKRDSDSMATSFNDDEVESSHQDVVTKFILLYLNMYFSNKHELSKLSNLTIKGVKAVCLMLLKNLEFDILSQLDLPKYAIQWVESAMEKLYKNKGKALIDFIDYLEVSGNDHLIDTVKSKGDNIWGTDLTNADDIFFANFTKHQRDNIIDYKSTYGKFMIYRQDYMHAVSNISIKSLYEIFNIKDRHQYDDGRSEAFYEIKLLLVKENESSELILKRLVYGK